MKKIYALAGLPGVGKTHYHKTNLSGMPLIDIADVYREYTHINPKSAFEEFLRRAEGALRKHDKIAVEAIFTPQSVQRPYLAALAAKYRAEIEWIELKCDRNQSRQRVIAQCLENLESDPMYWLRYTLARLEILGME